ncbi:MAG: hypothetical protein AB8H47_26685, partial [Bacteroidia bacterium]
TSVSRKTRKNLWRMLRVPQHPAKQEKTFGGCFEYLSIPQNKKKPLVDAEALEASIAAYHCFAERLNIDF